LRFATVLSQVLLYLCGDAAQSVPQQRLVVGFSSDWRARALLWPLLRFFHLFFQPAEDLASVVAELG